MLKKIFAIASFAVLFIPSLVFARSANTITDWYIKDFQSDITVNTDSSLDITEKIIADCGDLPGKHGIFRTLPTFYQKTANEKINIPIKLKSITDFNGNSIPFTTQHNYSDRTITWKIGDPNRTVTGENNYKITYHISNTIRFNNLQFDELYWNLNGAFWQLDIDHFVGTIHFPEGINKNNSTIDYYTGSFSSKSKDLATYSWLDDKTLQFSSSKVLKPGEAITVSVTFPKGIISPYKPGPIKKYGGYLLLLIPLITLIWSYRLWSKYGRDPKLKRTIIAEYEAPNNISPMEMGMLMENGGLDNKFISAAIVNLAVKKQIKIEEIPKEGIFGKKDFKLTRLKSDDNNIAPSEQTLLDRLFGIKEQLYLSSLKNQFYTDIPAIKQSVKDDLLNKGAFQKEGFKLQVTLFILSAIAFVLFIGITIGVMTLFPNLIGYAILSGILTVAILIIFAFLMPQLSEKGAELLWKTHGFKLYMETAEKYREQFNEKENIFEKFLPYAMVFGIVDLWVKKIKMIYGEEYFNTYHPYWYSGYAFANFDANSLTDSMETLSSQMATTLASSPSSSGSGGGGFSGGGGGGGGGGGW